MDAPQVAAKSRRAIKLQHDGREIRLRDLRGFRGQYFLFCQNVETSNEGDEQSRLLSLLLVAWVKRVTKEEAKRANGNHTVKMMLKEKHHKKVVNWTRAKVAWDFRGGSLQNSLLITVSGDRETAPIWRLDECEVGGQTISLQSFSARMSSDDLLEWLGEEVLKDYKNLAQKSTLQGGICSFHQVPTGSDGEAVTDPAGAKGSKGVAVDDVQDEPAETAVCAFPANYLHKASNRAGSKHLQ